MMLSLRLTLLTFIVASLGCRAVGDAIPFSLNWKQKSDDDTEYDVQAATHLSGQETSAQDDKVLKDLYDRSDDPQLKKALEDLLAHRNAGTEPKESSTGVNVQPYDPTETPSNASKSTTLTDDAPPAQQTAPNTTRSISDQPITTQTTTPPAGSSQANTDSTTQTTDEATSLTTTQSPPDATKSPAEESPDSKTSETSPATSTPSQPDAQDVTPQTEEPGSTQDISMTPLPATEEGSSTTTKPTTTKPTSDSTQQSPSPSESPTESQTAEAEDAKPTPQDWRVHFNQARETLEAILEDPADELTLQQRSELELRHRLLCIIANDQEAALKPFEVLSSERGEFWTEQLFGLSTLLDSQKFDPDSPFFTGEHRRAAIALEHFRNAAEPLSGMASLQVKNSHFCRDVKGFGNIEPFTTTTFTAGDPAVVYCELDNFAVEKALDSRGRSQEYKAEFRTSITLYDEDRSPKKHIDYLPIVDRCRNRRRDFYVTYDFVFPDDLPPGDYTLVVTVEDMNADKTASSPPMPFSIRQ